MSRGTHPSALFLFGLKILVAYSQGVFVVASPYRSGACKEKAAVACLPCWSGYALQDCVDPGSLATKAPPTLGHARLYPGVPAAKKWLAETYTANLPSNRLAHCPPSTKSFLLRASQAGALAKQSLMLAQMAVSVQVLLIGMQG